MERNKRTHKRPIELLSPARDLACGIAAIDHGADAVYIGPARYGARAAAGNSIDDIATLCRYAHQYGAHVYATVNTIIYDEELPDVRRLLCQLAEAGADAVLFQDMAVPMIVKEEGLPLQLHASTQTDNRTPEKVEWMHSLGACRVVLARELSAEEIAEIHRRVPDVELEVFVHGALCVSYSGLCYASHHCFARSANRGECAQLCRMKFDLTDADGHAIEHGRHLLSLKDLNQSRHLAELAEAGATSFKIEGRLKDMAYVKNTTAAYSLLTDRLISQHPDEYERASMGHCRYNFTPDLRKTFNRGYTTYFLHGRQPDIFSPDTPKAMGEFVGTVKALPAQRPTPGTRHAPHTSHPSVITVAGTASFSNGDGLCFIDDNRELRGFRVNRAEGNRLTLAGPVPPQLRRGMSLYRNNDQQMERLLAGKSSERKIPVTLTLTVIPDGFKLIADDGRRKATATIDCEHTKAQKPQTENIIRELSKLGNTVYECKAVILPPDFDFFIPASRLAELRRSCLASNMTAEMHDGGYRPSASRVRAGACVSPQENPSSLSAMTEEESGMKPYMLNVSNSLARKFYEQQGISPPPSFEQYEPEGEKVLMQCRHCLRFALGHCARNGGTRPAWREPLSLTLSNGSRFHVRFDCKRCVMEIIKFPKSAESNCSDCRQG